MRSILVPLMISLTACGRPGPSDTGASEDAVIQLSWQRGQTFHVASVEALTTAGGRVDAIDLAAPGDATPGGETWGPEHVWTYQVVDSGLLPSEDDVLAAHARDATGALVPITVLRASLDPSLNPQGALLASDPVVYLVFQAERNRLAGIVQYTTVDRERRVQAWSASDLEGAVGSLTQSHLALAPSWLAPWSARWVDDEHRLEDGSLVTSVAVDTARVDVVYDDMLGGALVSSRYERGLPWPTWTVAAGHESRLVDATELETFRIHDGSAPVAPPADEDYRRALASAPDLDGARQLPLDALETGRLRWTTDEGVRPWAGYWWPTRSAELVFGYGERPTFAEHLRERVVPHKEALEALVADGRYVEWGRRNEELNAEVMGFYDDLLARLDGGRLRIEDGRVVGVGPDEVPWDYALDTLSPMDKWAMVLWLQDEGTANPFLVPAWEIMNSYAPTGEGWWGHCNGWAAAAILTQQPDASRTITVGGQDIAFTTADQKGLLTEMHLGVSAHLFGSRYGTSASDDVSDLTPGAFFTLVGHFLGDRGVSLVVDSEATEAVWNYPIAEVDAALELVEDRSGRLDVNSASLQDLAAVDGIDEAQALAIVETRTARGAFQDLAELAAIDGLDPEALASVLTTDPVARVVHADIHLVLVTDAVGPEHVDADPDAPATESRDFGATLELDADGRIIGGRWDDPRNHPDFAWAPYANGVIWPDKGENRWLNYGDYLDLMGREAVER